MGTKKETLELQYQIKQLLSQLKWSQNGFARIVFTELNDIDNEEEIIKFQEKLKKELQRETTKPERLKEYLNIIFRHMEYEKIDLFFNKNSSVSSIDPDIVIEMVEISKEIDRMLKNK